MTFQVRTIEEAERGRGARHADLAEETPESAGDQETSIESDAGALTEGGTTQGLPLETTTDQSTRQQGEIEGIESPKEGETRGTTDREGEAETGQLARIDTTLQEGETPEIGAIAETLPNEGTESGMRNVEEKSLREMTTKFTPISKSKQLLRTPTWACFGMDFSGLQSRR